MTIDKRKLNAEIKRMIRNKFKDYIVDIRATIRLYSSWYICVYTNIYNDWYVIDRQKNEVIHLGKISENEVEKWIMQNGYDRYSIDWQLSYNKTLQNIKNTIEKMIIEKYDNLIGHYYEDMTNAKIPLLIVRVFPR